MERPSSVGERFDRFYTGGGEGAMTKKSDDMLARIEAFNQST
jgi:hypothetical protein